MSTDATTGFARTLVDEWVRGGVTHAVIAPGSRSAPLALALAENERITYHVILDERSAGFFALGIGRATGRPAVVLTTSGTAAANLHPAVLEAHHGSVPLIVCTADRPPELRDVGAPQTVDQVHLYGHAVRWFADAEVPTDRPGVGHAWRALAARVLVATLGPPAGPAHLNLPFRDPLVPTGAPVVEAPGRANGAPWVTRSVTVTRSGTPALLDLLAAEVTASERGVLALGADAAVSTATAQRFARASGWVIMADPRARLGAVDAGVGAYEALTRVETVAARHRPITVWRAGAPLTGPTVTGWLDTAQTNVLIEPNPRWRDQGAGVERVIPADPEALLDAVSARLDAGAAPNPDRRWQRTWGELDVVARQAIDATLNRWTESSEPRTARDLMATLPVDAALVVASSMPIRSVEWFAAPNRGVTVMANRGVNGIDGFVSTALGIAAARSAPTVALCGDLSFLHDGGGLLAARASGVNLTFVVIDNAGGGIFSFLPQAELPLHFETLFATPPDVDLAALGAVHGFHVSSVTEPNRLIPELQRAFATAGCGIVKVSTDRSRTVEHHREVWAAVATAVNESSGLAAPG